MTLYKMKKKKKISSFRVYALIYIDESFAETVHLYWEVNTKQSWVRDLTCSSQMNK